MKTADDWREIWINDTEVIDTETFEHRLTERIKAIQLDSWKHGMTDACKVVQGRADSYDSEHGHTDLETGTREYPKGGDDYMLELTEIIEAIASSRDKKEAI